VPGELAAGEMALLLNGRGIVLVLRHQEGVFSTEQREKGFVDKICGTSIVPSATA